jgi:hypothetical protein
MELHEDRLLVSRTLSELDEDVVQFTELLDEQGIDYVIVSGYVAILTGRSRGTEDIDIVIEPLPKAQLTELAAHLENEGYWGMAMPLDSLADMLTDGDRLRIAEHGEMYPNFKVWLASNEIEREALSTSIVADLGGQELSISAIELQIAYKLRLAEGSGSLDGKDFEDALHLYLTFDEGLNTEQLVAYIEQLGVEEYYDELRSV